VSSYEQKCRGGSCYEQSVRGIISYEHRCSGIISYERESSDCYFPFFEFIWLRQPSSAKMGFHKSLANLKIDGAYTGVYAWFLPYQAMFRQIRHCKVDREKKPENAKISVHLVFL
jgi:hypothetical protein